MALTGKNIICFSSIDWDFLWQGHQEIMSTFVKQGNKVLFVENTGTRGPRLNDFIRIKQRFLNWWHSIKGFRQVEDNLFVYSPLVLPFPYSRFARYINTRIINKDIKSWMSAENFYEPIIWVYIPTDLTVDLINLIDNELVIYYCVADFKLLISKPERILKSERRLLNKSDIVFAQGDVLGKNCLPHHNIHIFPAGVNTDIFYPDIKSAKELKSLKSPVVGYIGGIHQHIDLELIEYIAENIDGSIALVGPVQTDVSKLKKYSNISFISQQKPEQLPKFVSGFDVCIIPYVISEYTKTVYPTKLNEYLAMGKPVVSTNLPEVSQFNKENENIVYVSKDQKSFVQSISNAIKEDSAKKVQQRIKIAQKNSWSNRIEDMSRIISKELETKKKSKKDWKQSLLKVYKSTRSPVINITWAIIFIYLLLLYTPLLWIIAQPLKLDEAPAKADAIVVFGGGLGESLKTGGGYQERLRKSVKLYKDNQSSNIIFSSGYNFAYREAEVMKGLALKEDVPESSIILEPEARNTYENVKFVSEILKNKNWSSIILISSPYHMRRAVLTFNKAAPDITIISQPASETQFYEHNIGANTPQIKSIFFEYAAIVYYWWKGYI